MDWRTLNFGIAAAALALFTGCQGSLYDDRYVYQPRPMAVETPAGEQADGETVRALVSVVGVRRADDEAQLPASVHLRMRLDNTSQGVAEFDPTSLSLFAADVQAFPEPILQPAEPITLEPGEVATVDAYFPLPGDRIPGTMDLSGLGARWTIKADGRVVPASATFNRREIEYRYRREPRFNIGFGAGYHHHHHRWR